MKKISEHLGQIIVALACVALLVSAVVLFKAPIGDFYGNIVNKEVAVGNKVLDGIDNISVDDFFRNADGQLTTDELQSKYQFSYYSTLSGAVTDVNNGAIGETADANEENAVAGIYTNQDKIYVVLLKDTKETSKVLVSTDMIINLGGNTITFENSAVAFDTVANNNNVITIDGRLSGSAISVVSTGETHAIGVQIRATNKLVATGVEFITTAEEGRSCCISYSRGAVGGDLIDCSLTAEVTNGALRVIDLSRDNECVNINNCTMIGRSKSESQYAYGVYGGGNTKCIDSIIIVTNDNGTAKGYYNAGVAELSDCYVRGNHCGVNNLGELTVNGGTYESFGHGGFYFSGEGSTAYIANATIRECAMDPDYETNEASNGAGFYIGGSAGKDNITVYMDNCKIYGSKQPIVLRGTDGEQNNTLYISNSTINLDYTHTGVRIDNDTHKLYIGRGNNFTADNTTLASAVFVTDDVYVQD